MSNIMHILPSIFEEAFPGSRYFWKGEEYDIFEVADAKGLLPILVAQALVNADVFSPTMLTGWRITEETQSLTGRGVCTPSTESPQYILGIPWILDALYVAVGRGENPYEICLDNIDPAIVPSLSEVLRDQRGTPQQARVVPE